MSSGARRIAQILDRTGRHYLECWFGNARLARVLGVSVGTIQRWLRELELRGFISIVRDHAIRCHRKIILLWRSVTVLTTTPEVEPDVADCPAVLVPATPDPLPPSAPRDKDEARKATPEEVARVVARAQLQFPTIQHRLIVDLARVYSLSWVSRAVEAAIKNNAYDSHYLFACLKRWDEDGGPPALGVTKAEKERAHWARIDRVLKERYG